MSDLLFSEDLEEYRKIEIEEALVFVGELYRQNIEPEYFKGAMEMLKRIIRIPLKMAKSLEEKKRAELMIAQAIDDYASRLVKKILLDEE
jgi:hypothetical protein